MRRWPLTSFGSYRPGPYPHKGKGVCVRDVCAIYDNNISPSLLMIMIKIIILYFIQIRHTDDFPRTGTLLVMITIAYSQIQPVNNRVKVHFDVSLVILSPCIGAYVEEG